MTASSSVRMSGLQVVIILLTIATALIHLWLGLGGPSLDIMFTLNGLGYLTLAVVGYVSLAPLAKYQTLARWALVAFTAVTIIGWVLIGQRIALGYITKVIEAALIILVVLDLRKK